MDREVTDAQDLGAGSVGEEQFSLPRVLVKYPWQREGHWYARDHLPHRGCRHRSCHHQLRILRRKGADMSTHTEPKSDRAAKSAPNDDPRSDPSRDRFRDPSGTAAEEARKLKQDAAEQAKTLREEATEHLRVRTESAKKTFADDVLSAGDALRNASKELREDSVQERLFTTMATSLSDLAETVRNRQITDTFDEIDRFGRRNPAAFLGGAALLGFFAVRMARASQSGHSHETASSTAQLGQSNRRMGTETKGEK